MKILGGRFSMIICKIRTGFTADDKVNVGAYLSGIQQQFSFFNGDGFAVASDQDLSFLIKSSLPAYQIQKGLRIILHHEVFKTFLLLL